MENGNAPGCAGARKSADKFACDIRDFIKPYVSKGLTDAAIATALNEDGIETRRAAVVDANGNIIRRGGRWYETSVRRLRARLAI